MQSIVIQGTAREELGKKSAKAIRRDGGVPCVLYGQSGNVHFSADSKSFKDLIYTPDFHKVELEVAGNKYEAILKDVQYHPLKDTVEHVDFQELTPGRPVITQIPVKLVGNSEGVKAGGKLQLKVRKLDVKVKPEDLVERIEVNVDDLQLGKSMKISQIDTGNIQVMNPPGIPVASCEIPRALKSKASKAEAAAEGAEAAPAEEAAAE